MHTRIDTMITHYTDGRRREFAQRLGWSMPYLSKVLRGDAVGLTPVLTILSTFPELNARWLLFGVGKMIERKK